MNRDPFNRVRIRQGTRWFVYAVRGRVVMPRNFFIRFAHRDWVASCRRAA